MSFYTTLLRADDAQRPLRHKSKMAKALARHLEVEELELEFHDDFAELDIREAHSKHEVFHSL